MTCPCCKSNEVVGGEMNKYWYYTAKHVCVLCGRENIVRTRRYTPKPESWNDRNVWIDEACDDCWGNR